MSKKYSSIIDHYERCLSKYGDTHLGVDWPNQLDAEKRYQIMLGILPGNTSETSLLDFGCGASHLYSHIEKKGLLLDYTGLDVSPAFCQLSREKFPNNKYICLDVLEFPDQLSEYDFIVMNGVFTEKRDLRFDEMFTYFTSILNIVFKRARKGIAFNVMSKAVDWERDDLFHLSTDLLIEFITKKLSRNFVIRNDYGLYEYTVYVYKDFNNE